MSGPLVPGRNLPGTNILEPLNPMNPHHTSAGRTFLAVGAVATDRHEIPVFVLDRTEIAVGADDVARAASPRAAHPIPAEGAIPAVRR
jgi:hypothetical protein